MLPIWKCSLVCLLVLLAGGSAVLGQPPTEKKEPPTVPPAARTAADQLLDRAVDKLGKLGAYETEFQHHVNAQGTRLHTTGRFALAPGRKVLYACNLSFADTQGSLKVLCDGDKIYRVRDALGERVVTTYPLAKLDAARENLKNDYGELELPQVEELLEDLAADHGFAGTRPLLADLQKRMTFSRLEPGTLKREGEAAIPVYVLEGEWTKAALERIAPAKKADDPNPNAPDARKLWEERRAFAFMPRKARLFLARDGAWPWTDSLWPYRLELLGPTVPGGDNEVVFTLDLKAPSLKTPPDSQFQLSEEEKKLKAHELDPLDLVKARREVALRQKAARETQGLAPLSPQSPLTTPPPTKKP
jgi:hypothetical protein